MYHPEKKGDYLGLVSGLLPSLPEWSADVCSRKATRDWNSWLHCSHLNFPAVTSWWLARLTWYFSPQRDLKSWLQPSTGHSTTPFCESCSFSSTRFSFIGRSSGSVACDMARITQSTKYDAKRNNFHSGINFFVPKLIWSADCLFESQKEGKNSFFFLFTFLFFNFYYLILLLTKNAFLSFHYVHST